MARSKVNANWKLVSFASTTLTRINSCQFGHGASITYYKGDGDIIPTVAGLLDMKPTASISSADQYAFANISPGTAGTLVAKTGDLTAAGAGSTVVYTLSNAIFEGMSGAGGSQGQVGSVTGAWGSFSADGTTNPLTVTLE